MTDLGTSNPEASSPADDIGPRLRALRVEQGLSVREVARQADVTAGFISQLERGNVQVSIVTLFRICKVLGATVHDTLAPREPAFSVTRAGDRGQMVLPSKKANVDVLVNVAGRPFDLLMVNLAPGSATSPNLAGHNAKEAMLIIEGTAIMTIGTATVKLEVGDTIYLDANTPHRIENTGEAELRFVNCIVGEL